MKRIADAQPEASETSCVNWLNTPARAYLERPHRQAGTASLVGTAKSVPKASRQGGPPNRQVSLGPLRRIRWYAYAPASNSSPSTTNDSTLYPCSSAAMS